MRTLLISHVLVIAVTSITISAIISACAPPPPPPAPPAPPHPFAAKSHVEPPAHVYPAKQQQ